MKVSAAKLSYSESVGIGTRINHSEHSLRTATVNTPNTVERLTSPSKKGPNDPLIIVG